MALLPSLSVESEGATSGFSLLEPSWDEPGGSHLTDTADTKHLAYVILLWL